jgi:hypothetical protein
MPLWVFVFTQPGDLLQSARVAAETRAQAWIIVKGMLGHAPNGTIVNFGGEIEATEADLISFDERAA